MLRSNHQVKCLQTLIRDRTTLREDFIFYSDRLIRLLIEEGLNFLPFSEKVVTTPTGSQYPGTLFATKVSPFTLLNYIYHLYLIFNSYVSLCFHRPLIDTVSPSYLSIADMWCINCEGRREYGGRTQGCLQTH